MTCDQNPHFRIPHAFGCPCYLPEAPPHLTTATILTIAAPAAQADRSVAGEGELTSGRIADIKANTRKVRVEPITEIGLPQAAEFLFRQPGIADGVTAEEWVASVTPTSTIDAPNRGFMLIDGGDVVGVYLALYSSRLIDGINERFCNLCAWVVLPDYRLHSLKLLEAILGQDGYTFTDFSPVPSVQRIEGRFGFQFLDTTMTATVNLPWPSWPGRVSVSSDPVVVAETLQGKDLEVYRDHAGMLAARHVVLVSGSEWCYVMYRNQRHKRLPCAAILYVSNPELFRSMIRPLARHLLLKRRRLAMLAELRVVGQHLPLSILMTGHPQKMYRSSHLESDQIDYLYSELTCLPS